MQIYNSDETGVTIVFKPGKVVTELGQRNVYSVSAAERGKTHTILSCVSACGFVLPPMMIYPRKRPVPEHLRESAYPNTLFASSETGWINAQLYLDWFKFFLENVPPTRPILLIQDGHHSHVSIELIELARANDVHLLCLPAHTSHLLQPLDVGVFKSFKSNFNKACSKYMSEYPGRVITTDILASIVAKAYPLSFTPVNIMSGFKKSGVWPINTGEVTDRHIAPSTALRVQTKTLDPACDSNLDEPIQDSPLFSPELEAFYKKRYEEKYDIVDDPEYIAWLKINHPVVNLSGSYSDTSSEKQESQTSNVSSISYGTSITSNSSDVLSEVLVFPKPKKKTESKRRGGLNTKTICITDDDVLGELKAKKQEKEEEEKQKLEKQEERKKKRFEKEKMKKEKEEQRKEKRLEKEKQKKERDLAKEKQRKNRELKKQVIKKDNVNSEGRVQKESDIESDL